MAIKDALSKQAFVSILRQAIGIYEDPNAPPRPPGPLDPVIRRALERMSVARGPDPDAWRSGPEADPWRWGPSPVPDPWRFQNGSHQARRSIDAFGLHPWIWAALNPQPLPPRVAFISSLAQVVIERAELIQDLAETRREGDEQGIVGGYVSRFVDDYCGTDRWPRWPFPWPRPWWFSEEITGVDLIVTGLEFERAAANTFGAGLKSALEDASAKLTEVGLERLG